MTDCFEFDIRKIYMIAGKTESERFVFRNDCREWDGFVLFTNGVGSYIDANQTVHAIKRGSLVLLNKNDCYAFDTVGSCSYITAAFDFSVQCKELESLPKLLTVNEKQIAEISALCEIWQKRKPSSVMRCKAGLYTLYSNVIEHSYTGSPTTEHAVRVALEFIHENYPRNFAFGEIAAQCRLSPSYLRAIFRRVMNMSVTEYRDLLRTESAKEMLTSGCFSVKETANRLGYCDVYHFTKVFTKLHGISPAKYARALR